MKVRDLLGPGGLFESCVDGFVARDPQIAMAEAIERTITTGGTVVVEAPTGVGKTLAYLVPALLSGRRVVVSTHTKTLQDQIVERDLPALGRVLEQAGLHLQRARLGQDPPQPNVRTFALMKGRANYLCWDRFERARKQTAFIFDSTNDPLDQIAAWSKSTERGDRAELTTLAEDTPVWPEVDARSETCKGSRCAHYDDCFVVKMRAEAATADLIVVNHHLLFADLALKAQADLRGGRGFGAVIPEADVLVVDEAHAMEVAASDHFGGRVSAKQWERLALDASAYVQDLQHRSDVALLLLKATESVLAVYGALSLTEGKTRLSVDTVEVRPARALLDKAREDAEQLALVLEAANLEREGGEHLANRARSLIEAMAFVLQAEDGDFVYWASRQRKEVSLGAAPVRVAGLLAQHLYPSFETTVLTSATLAAGRSGLRYFSEAVGLPKSAEEHVLESPFDFARQAVLYMPTDAPTPDAPDTVARLAELGLSLVELVGGGAMFLFTSHRVLRKVHARMKPRLQYEVLMQGEMEKRQLLAAFVERAPAVLFATASFWEGVDVPGDALRLVMIDRLPFASPDDPRVAAQSEALTAQGISPFARQHLPHAILRLKQGFGRLVRGTDDRGVVAILDRRLRTRGYGPRFLAALPPARRIAHLEELQSWWSSPDAAITAAPLDGAAELRLGGPRD